MADDGISGGPKDAPAADGKAGKVTGTLGCLVILCGLVAVGAWIYWIFSDFSSLPTYLTALTATGVVFFGVVVAVVVGVAEKPWRYAHRAVAICGALLIGLAAPAAGAAIAALAVDGTNPYVWQYGQPVVAHVAAKCNYTAETRDGGAPRVATDIRCPGSSWVTADGVTRHGMLIIAFTEFFGPNFERVTTTAIQARAIGGKAVTPSVGRIRSMADIGRVPHPWWLLGAVPVLIVIGGYLTIYAAVKSLPQGKE